MRDERTDSWPNATPNTPCQGGGPHDLAEVLTTALLQIMHGFAGDEAALHAAFAAYLRDALHDLRQQLITEIRITE